MRIWLLPLTFVGFRRTLTMGDLRPLPVEYTTEVIAAGFHAVWNRLKQKKRKSRVIKDGNNMEFQLTCAITFKERKNDYLLNWQFCGAHQLKEKTFGLSRRLISHAAFLNTSMKMRLALKLAIAIHDHMNAMVIMIMQICFCTGGYSHFNNYNIMLTADKLFP